MLFSGVLKPQKQNIIQIDFKRGLIVTPNGELNGTRQSINTENRSPNEINNSQQAVSPRGSSGGTLKTIK